MSRGRRGAPGAGEPDLFSFDADPQVRLRLGNQEWPSFDEFPVNHSNARVGRQVWADLTTSREPLILAGYASLDKIVELVAAAAHKPDPGRVRVLLGTEPFATQRRNFGSATAHFDADVRQYWIEERGISLRLSAMLVQTIGALEAGWFEVRFVPGETRLHAKVFVGSDAVTIGSSNFTENGLNRQFEANVRFERSRERSRYADARQIAENYWAIGQSWTDEMIALLKDLLSFVTWEEALARACAELLEGQWAEDYLGKTAGISRLWPSQVAGIAEALWVVENVGSVLVADATGSGKTRMGAHLTRAVRDRLWNTGRVRSDLTVLVCPPAVERQWERESASCGLTLRAVSHGKLSRRSENGTRDEAKLVAEAQILAIDEAHNFLAPNSNRTAHVRNSAADHVLMFTATPINRGAQDLLALVDLLGADNFEDATLDVLDRLNRARRGPKNGFRAELAPADRDMLRREIQRFTVRRTKPMLNAMVAREPHLYQRSDDGRTAGYPDHRSATYSTGETAADCELAERIREISRELAGVTLLGDVMEVPSWMRPVPDHAEWLRGRLAAAQGLAGYHVRSGMRSSRAALLEHVIGTSAAVEFLGIQDLVKGQATGNMIEKVRRTGEKGPPQVRLDCEKPDWLADPAAWRAVCDAEIARYEHIVEQAKLLSDTRERTKASFVRSLTRSHDRVLAFDHHPITLTVIRGLIGSGDVPVYLASGSTQGARRDVQAEFAPGATSRGIALCSDAMSEGINLQGASAIVQFDMPTTLRVAEQRVGRVDRMDSPYASIEVWWPGDGPSFRTRADDRLAARNDESSELLGSNLPVPGSIGPAPVEITHEDIEREIAAGPAAWDGILDALEPVRSLVDGPTALIAPEVYGAHRDTHHRVLARVSVLRAEKDWAFFAVRAAASGAPRWILLEGDGKDPAIGLDAVTARLRELLADDPQSAEFDDACDAVLARFLKAAARSEKALLPRRFQRALEQMHRTCVIWATEAVRSGRGDEAETWSKLARVTEVDPDAEAVDLHQAAELWLGLVRPLRAEVRVKQRRKRYSRLSDIDRSLQERPLSINDVTEAFGSLRFVEPLSQRIASCIIGVPGPG